MTVLYVICVSRPQFERRNRDSHFKTAIFFASKYSQFRFPIGINSFEAITVCAEKSQTYIYLYKYIAYCKIGVIDLHNLFVEQFACSHVYCRLLQPFHMRRERKAMG